MNFNLYHIESVLDLGFVNQLFQPFCKLWALNLLEEVVLYTLNHLVEKLSVLLESISFVKFPI